MKGGYVELSVYLACLSFILNFYASFITLSGVLAHLLLFIFVSCGLFGILLRYRIPKPKDSVIRNIFGADWGAYASFKTEKTNESYAMKVIAHRACGLDAPENSLSALAKINSEGLRAVEFDVLMSADSIPIVFHDISLCRMTGVNKSVMELTYEEIKELDISVKHPFGKHFQGEKIPSLNEYVSYCLDNSIRMFIDLKDGHNNVVQIITDLYKQYPEMYELTVVTSFDAFLIYKLFYFSFSLTLMMSTTEGVHKTLASMIRAKDPKITCSLAWRPYFYSHQEFNEKEGPSQPRTNNLWFLMLLRFLNIFHQWALWKFGYYILGLSALLLHKDMITREMVHYWNKRGIRVIAWSVNLPTEKQYFEKILQITYLTDTVINS